MALIDNCEAYYKLDVDSSSQTDSTGNGNTGTVTSATYTSSGKINGGYDFDGSNDYIDIDGIQTYVKKTEDYTVSLWFKADTPNDSGGVIFQSGTGATDRNVIRLAGNSLVGNIYTGSWINNNIGSTSFTDTSSWHHIVMIRDSSSNSVTVYLDDSLITGNDNNGGASSSGAIIGANTGTSNHFNGKIDEIGIWSRKLISSEVTQLYNSDAGLSYPFATPEETEDNALMIGTNM